MILWVLSVTVLATAPDMQESCPAGRPVRLVSNVVPALGQSPLWAATGGKPVEWEGPRTPARVLWLRDVGVKGPAFLSGKQAGGTATAAFGSSLYGNREQ